MTSSSSTSVAASVVTSGGTKICFNTYCKEQKSETLGSARRKGWRLRTGELADLCDRCSTTFEQGTFCEIFHLDDDGWRKCETCGKRVHCGCIASTASFVLLDVGGVECVSCAQKSFVLGSNQMWSSSFLQSERLKEIPTKNWSQQLSTNSPVHGQWRQASNAWSSAVAAQSELHQRLSFEFDRPNSIERLISANRSLVSDKQKNDDHPERPISAGLSRITIDKLANGNTGPKTSGFNAFPMEDFSASRLQESSHLMGDNDSIPTRRGVIHGSRFSSSTGIKVEKVPTTCLTAPLRLKDDLGTPLNGVSTSFSPSFEANDQFRMTSNLAQNQTTPSTLAKQLYHNHNNGADLTESHAHIRSGRLRVDARNRTQLLPRYWPRITDQELQQISGDSNSVITPLFEKMLSASDAGRIGRLVLPKKCAEAYFPAISQPEGLPLKVQDSSGKEWVFQFRFWPNNNSRMYVLEGVTPCIQAMQLQAGDIVTFSRIDPEGKLVMGFRKASNTQNEQTPKSGNILSSMSDTSNKFNKHGEMVAGLPSCPVKGGVELTRTNTGDRTTWFKNDKEEFLQKEKPASKSSILPTKRSSSVVGSKTKRLRIENEDSIELKLTWEEAQELLRPPPRHAPSVVVIDGHEFEEYEEAPVLGKPNLFTVNQDGGKDQWVQCEDCSKWRKLPVNALLPLRWTCSDNIWDPERSSCSTSQEISQEELVDLLPCNYANPKKNKAKVESDLVDGSDGLDTLANLAILGEGDSLPNSSQPTTKHPRHRAGCTCIVCIQPPSGKGPKHKQTCCCNVCLTVKRRFRTLMLRKEKRQSEKDAETARKKHQETQSPETPEEASQQEMDDKPVACNNVTNQTKNVSTTDGMADEDADRVKELLSPVKAGIDLNMQPEREEDASPISDLDNTTKPDHKLTSS